MLSVYGRYGVPFADTAAGTSSCKLTGLNIIGQKLKPLQ